MTTAPTPDLRTLAEAVKNWSTCNEAWPHAEHFDVAMVGGITDGEQYPLAQIDADTYGTDGESLKLAQFYAAANPGAVLALLDRVAELEARLVTEASATAEHKLRADQPAQQHRMQAQMHAQATQQLAELEARKPLPLSDEQIDAIADGMPGGLGGFMKTWGWRQFARKILDLRAPPTWEPQFDCMAPGQEELAMQLCLEIAGPRGKKGSPPDPVRLLEMAQALYKAEADARPKET
ncbi:ead/Ea22-like family protein [Delftia acidovorans]|uniref:ead/Ea22-like family protein n=1 Tax=Delftia acidovorans TaxID=80866 RepID=UPI001EE12842|nr:ead/Ea22-like family protein [Delftia acidovorans]MCG3783285.1 ead/Ea22-like family protein [Delftia acidovorans]